MRNKIPARVQTRVLVTAKRRCCLCFHFYGDFSVKEGQLAHVDHDRSNNAEENLVFLCFVHHHWYDSHSTIGKGLTTGEVLEARRTLQNHVRDVSAHVNKAGAGPPWFAAPWMSPQGAEPQKKLATPFCK